MRRKKHDYNIKILIMSDKKRRTKKRKEKESAEVRGSSGHSGFLIMRKIHTAVGRKIV